MMVRKIQRASYFQMTMKKDCINYVGKFDKCQIYRDKIKSSSFALLNMTSPWPFAIWRLNVIGPTYPKTKNGHRLYYVAINYFTKWIRACSFTQVSQKVVKRFIERDLICQNRQTERIFIDNINCKIIITLCDKQRIKHMNSYPYRPKMIGFVKAAKKA